MTRKPSCVLAAAVALGLFSACADSKSSGPDETVAPSDGAAPLSDPPSTPAPTTIAATTLAPTTTVVPQAFLRGDGLGPFDRGTPYAEVVAGIALQKVSDDGIEFPVAQGDFDFYCTADGSLCFWWPSGRVVCWDDGGGARLCAYFGGASAAAVELVGWDYASTAGVGLLFSADGATVNILISDTALPLPNEECEIEGFSTLILEDDLVVTLVANNGDRFGEWVGNSYVPAVPPPAGATVDKMYTGRQVSTPGVTPACYIYSH